MSLIRPFPALRPNPEYAAAVAAPPYDVMGADEARAIAAANPLSFVHISRAEVDLEPGCDPYAPEVYARAAENLSQLRRQGVLIEDSDAGYYVYRVMFEGGSQTGLAAVASVDAYVAGKIRRHELTRPDKENDRVRQIEALNAQTGPVFLCYPEAPHIDRILERQTAVPPLYQVADEKGGMHQVWRVDDADTCASLTAAFDKLPALYVADGHHRSAAAARVAARRMDEFGDAGESGYFLSVIFPHHQLRILDYNRVVRDLNGLAPQTLLQRLAENFEVRPWGAAVSPGAAGGFGMYLDGRWYRLLLNPDLIPRRDPVGSLDISLLERFVLRPILGIGDQRTDDRIDFIGGIRGLRALSERVDSGQAAVAFSLFPTSIEALMAVSDAGLVMPPKSTWFEPKLLDGLLSHPI